MNKLLSSWEEDLAELVATLCSIGEKGDSFQYNILSAQALRLSMCISDLKGTMLDERL